MSTTPAVSSTANRTRRATNSGLSRVTLHLARSHEHPEGSGLHGYEIVAPLTSSGKLDPEAWKECRNLCTVRRFCAGEPDRRGVLVHRPGGAEGATWWIDYDPTSFADDEAGYRLGSHVFAEGEYVSIRDDNGDMLTLKVVSVRPFSD